ncbi:MAG: tetratricopeptide repeat protein [Planctomycetota bacterium]
MRHSTLLATLTLAVLASCASAPRGEVSAPRFDGMGSHTRPSGSDLPLAQTYFDQGLALSYGFNHDEAVRSFEAVAELDPDCAMAYWGQAYALGPNINLPVDDARSRRAYVAVQRALALSDGAAPVDRALIEALATRFAAEPPADRQALDLAYAAAMRGVWERFANDTDVGVLYADALMNLTPWALWTHDFEPTEYTERIIAALDRVLELDPQHPFANHLYIHTLEASGEPGRAEAAADRLVDLIPGSGHLVHMPSHIYVQVGRYADAVRVNVRGSDLDREYFEAARPQGIYHYYHAHNNHFRVWSALYMGDFDDARAALEQTLADLPEPLAADVSVSEWLALEPHVHLRFGEWERILALPEPPAHLPYVRASWHYGRGVAYANTGQIEAARAEARAFELEAARVADEQLGFISSPPAVLAIARHMLAGETEYKAGDVERGLAELRLAVEAEDALDYAEPSPWMVPTRHALGALLLEQGAVAEAQAAYEQDLRRHPGNVWSLHGLAECLERSGDRQGASECRAQLADAQAHASVPVEASCFCRTDGVAWQ